jgi:aspartyl-tRNA(Asn)/glutamyl-tRNA(Gln) amidotransferase subunit B
MGPLKPENKTIAQSPVAPSQLRDLVRLIDAGTIRKKLPKKSSTKCSPAAEAEEIVEERGLTQNSEPPSLKPICQKVIAANANAVQD